MNRILFPIVLLLIFLNNVDGQVQLNKPRISHFETINAQVWYPFIEAYEKLDANAFMSIHSSSLVRLNLDEGLNLDYKNYTNQQIEENEYHTSKSNKRKIELRFDHRSMKGNFCYEIGYYKSTVYEKGQSQGQEYYGKFNVILQKETDQWLIILDADHGGATKANFNDAYAINDFQSFPTGLLK